jgi:hypothetical protein
MCEELGDDGPRVVVVGDLLESGVKDERTHGHLGGYQRERIDERAAERRPPPA